LNEMTVPGFVISRLMRTRTQYHFAIIYVHVLTIATLYRLWISRTPYKEAHTWQHVKQEVENKILH